MKKLIIASLLAFCMFAGTFAGATLSQAATTNGQIQTTAWPYLKSVPYSNQGKIYGSVPKGTKLDVLEKTNKYYIKVNYKGKTGYISTKYIKYLSSGSTPQPAPSEPTKPTQPSKPSTGTANWEVVADKIIANAKKLQGKVQYKYGKYDVNNLLFDCSSFTAYLYKQQGIKLKWGARAQFQQGKEISKSQLRKGDLVFISTSATDKKYTDKLHKIGHVGIYIGNNKIIHNVNEKSDVTISDLNSSWYKKHYVTAARVIQ